MVYYYKPPISENHSQLIWTTSASSTDPLMDTNTNEGSSDETSSSDQHALYNENIDISEDASDSSTENHIIQLREEVYLNKKQHDELIQENKELKQEVNELKEEMRSMKAIVDAISSRENKI